jgi:hypothetical protein
MKYDDVAVLKICKGTNSEYARPEIAVGLSNRQDGRIVGGYGVYVAHISDQQNVIVPRVGWNRTTGDPADD